MRPSLRPTLRNALDRPAFAVPQEAQDLNEDLARHDEIEAGIRELAPRRGMMPVVDNVLQLPEYVDHQEGTSDVGKITSAALVQEYEAAAKALEATADRLKENVQLNERQVLESVRGLEDLRVKTDDAVEALERTAAKYREEAARIFSQVQNSSKLADEVRRVCDELANKIQSPGGSRS